MQTEQLFEKLFGLVSIKEDNQKEIIEILRDDKNSAIIKEVINTILDDDNAGVDLNAPSFHSWSLAKKVEENNFEVLANKLKELNII